MDSMSGEPLESMPMPAHVIAMARIRAGAVAEEPDSGPLVGHLHAGDGFAAMTLTTIDLSEATYVWLLNDPELVESVREVGKNLIDAADSAALVNHYPIGERVDCPMCGRQLFGVVKARGICFGCLPEDDGKDPLTLTDQEARDRGWISE